MIKTGIEIHDIELVRTFDGINIKGYLPFMEVAAELWAKSILISIFTSNRNYYMGKSGKHCGYERNLD